MRGGRHPGQAAEGGASRDLYAVSCRERTAYGSPLARGRRTEWSIFHFAWTGISAVMPALVAGIHVLAAQCVGWIERSETHRQSASPVMMGIASLNPSYKAMRVVSRLLPFLLLQLGRLAQRGVDAALPAAAFCGQDFSSANICLMTFSNSGSRTVAISHIVCGSTRSYSCRNTLPMPAIFAHAMWG